MVGGKPGLILETASVRTRLNLHIPFKGSIECRVKERSKLTRAEGVRATGKPVDESKNVGSIQARRISLKFSCSKKTGLISGASTSLGLKRNEETALI